MFYNLSFSQCVQPKVANGTSMLIGAVTVFIKKQITKPFSEEIFWPAESKSLRLRSAASEMHLCHGVWGSPFKGSLLPALKQFFVSSEKVPKQSLTSHRILSIQRKC